MSAHIILSCVGVIRVTATNSFSKNWHVVAGFRLLAYANPERDAMVILRILPEIINKSEMYCVKMCIYNLHN